MVSTSFCVVFSEVFLLSSLEQKWLSLLRALNTCDNLNPVGVGHLQSTAEGVKASTFFFGCSACLTGHIWDNIGNRKCSQVRCQNEVQELLIRPCLTSSVENDSVYDVVTMHTVVKLTEMPNYFIQTFPRRSLSCDRLPGIQSSRWVVRFLVHIRGADCFCCTTTVLLLYG